MSHFLPLVVPDLPMFFLLFRDLTPNFASKLEARSKPLDFLMEVPAPDLRFMSTKSISGIKAILNVLNYLINPAIMHAGSYEY